VRTAGLGGASDVRLWEMALAGGFAILTRDEDFIRLSIARGHPPKVVHVQLGNCTTRDVVDLIRRRSNRIGEFFTSSDAGFLVVC
jgi:predicted nuclease of predicted toxin-antitoxin system